MGSTGTGTAGPSFPAGEIPDHETARYWLTIYLLVAITFWLVLVPLWGYFLVKAERRAKRRKSSPELSICCFVVVGFLATASLVLFSASPNNAFGRSVFEAPLFTKEECDTLLQKSQAAARDNARQAHSILEKDSSNETANALLLEPKGWQKTRHGNYPTTDLNLVTDPFTVDDRAWLGDLLDHRLTPTLSRIYGIPAAAIRANDMFIVRYDEGFRVDLANHTDDSDISFNILLNDGFTGGGTRFWNRIDEQPFAHVQPVAPGTLLVHSARINHEGMPILSGSRMILVGFLSIDRINPFTYEHTGLSVFASWLDFNWLTVKFVSAHRAAKDQEAESLASRIFLTFSNIFEALGDTLGRHSYNRLVHPSDTHQYLTVLNSTLPQEPGASWFKGQQVSLDFWGRLHKSWTMRVRHADRFSEL